MERSYADVEWAGKEQELRFAVEDAYARLQHGAYRTHAQREAAFAFIIEHQGLLSPKQWQVMEAVYDHHLALEKQRELEREALKTAVTRPDQIRLHQEPSAEDLDKVA